MPALARDLEESGGVVKSRKKYFLRKSLLDKRKNQQTRINLASHPPRLRRTGEGFLEGVDDEKNFFLMPPLWMFFEPVEYNAYSLSVSNYVRQTQEISTKSASDCLCREPIVFLPFDSLSDSLRL